jgi:hypothetical protein
MEKETTETVEETPTVNKDEMYLSMTEVTAFLDQVLMGLTGMAHGIQQTIDNVKEIATKRQGEQNNDE